MYDFAEDTENSGKVLKVFNRKCDFHMKLREVTMYKLFRNRESELHKHLVKTLGGAVYEGSDAIILEKVVMEGFGDLFDYISSKTERIDDFQLSNFMRQLLNGMSFFHEQGYKHNDLKLENIMITTGMHPNDIILKIADFGFSHHDDWIWNGNKFGSLQSKGGLYEYFGSKSYLPGIALSIDSFAFKRDEWALGIIFFMLSYSRMLYYDFKDTIHAESQESCLFQVGPNKKYKYFADLYGINPRGSETIIQCFLNRNPKSIEEVQKMYVE